MNPQSRKRVLHVFGRMQRGGAEMRTVDVMRYIDRARFDFRFCTLSGMPGDLDPAIRALGGEVYPAKLSPTFPFRFVQLLRALQVDVVHSHVELFSGFILWLARQAGVGARIAHFRNTSDGHPPTVRRRVQRGVMRNLLNANATKILAVSEGAMDESWSREWRTDPRCAVVYNGLPRDEFVRNRDMKGVREEFGLPLDAELLVHVGRMDPAKNHERVVKIFANIFRQRPRARLLLVGRGGNDIERRVRALVRDHRLEETVVLAGVRDDVPRLLCGADLLLFPSQWEGLPGAVLEACAAGLPVVASDLPGIREIAVHCPTVAVVSLSAPEDEWARCAVAALASGRVPEPGTAVEAFARTPFTVERCVSTLQDIYAGA